MDKNRSAFTLIELLVVVAIIVVLVAILLPSLGRARGQAKNLACQANIRSLLIADIMYADENGSLTTPVATGSGSQHWWDYLRPYWKYQIYPAADGTNKSAPFCAVFIETVPMHASYQGSYTGYHFNNNFYSNGLGKRTSVTANHSRVVRIWDDMQVNNYDGGFPWQDGGATNGGSWYKLDFRHVNSLCNLGMFDGHVESIKYTDRGDKGELMSYPTAYSYRKLAWDQYNMVSK